MNEPFQINIDTNMMSFHVIMVSSQACEQDCHSNPGVAYFELYSKGSFKYWHNIQS